MYPLGSTPFTSLLSSYLQVVPLFSSPSSIISSGIPPDLHSSLAPLLSTSAQILFPSSPSWEKYSARWRSDSTKPTYSLIVVPATEEDVATTVKYASFHNIPFFGTSGGHASYSGLQELRDGIGISLTALDKIFLDKDGKTATIQGGANVAQVINYLWERGKQTTTGTCGCVGVVSPGLGGGHGLLQGKYGLVGDQIVSARLVLWDGETITVSEKEHRGLFWGLRGAGHNFGIVTELKVKVYDVTEKEETEWSYEGFTFTGEKLEKIYEVAQEKMRVQGKELVIWSLWGRGGGVSDQPVINLQFIYNGPDATLKTITKDVLATIGPAAGYESGHSVSYPDLIKWMGNGIGSFICQKGNNAFTRAAYVREYEIPALRKWYDRYSEMLKKEPGLGNSVALVEGYSTQGVEGVPEDSTAFPHRGQRVLLAPVFFWEKGNATLDERAAYWGKELWEVSSGSTERRVYVNYAFGDEPLESIYGYEPWRLEKLRKLKKQYDPKGQFSYMVPFEEDISYDL
ncbi:hypothetical protein QBC35DRAFT_526362 [Podospora australis]|uniref:FAD-binding PCMH-type domain-containing protein n=1 Tax=Podospora australis TaxID=1536484 RepID=A0AAN6WJY4_9PEZI|nr:hypothetical protein QBC35DRAFT_526362 [Podospora australis]